jgi:predicted ATPase
MEGKSGKRVPADWFAVYSGGEKLDLGPKAVTAYCEHENHAAEMIKRWPGTGYYEGVGGARVVLTGGPCCGKTALIDELKSRGHSVLEEVARGVLEERGHLEATTEEWTIRQRMMFDGQIVGEECLDAKLSFLDRGVPDVFAYSQYYLGSLPKGTSLHQACGRYDSVFVLDMLPFEDDGLRVESGEAEARKIHEHIISAYLNTGYDPIQVPVFSKKTKKASIKARADHVLEKLDERD